LQALRSGIVAEKIFENGEDVLAILNHAFQDGAKLRLALGFAIPLREDSGGYANVAAQFVGGVTAQKEAVEKCGFALRELEVLQTFVERIGHSRHGRNRSLQISMSASSSAAAKGEILIGRARKFNATGGMKVAVRRAREAGRPGAA
jgi:hypothetical protein